MAVKKLISSPSASSSSDSSFQRFLAQRSPSLKSKQRDSEGEEKESEDDSSSSDEDEEVEDKEETKSPATKSHQPENEGEEKESESEDSSSSSSDEDEEEEEDKEETKSSATISVPHPSQQSSEEEDAKSPVENSESHQPENKKLKPNSVPAKKQISSPSASSSDDDANDSSSDEEQFVAQHTPSLKRKQQHSKEEVSEDSSDEEEDKEKGKSPATKCVSHPSQAQQSCTKEEKEEKDTKESVLHPYQQSSEEEEKEEQEEDAKLSVENSESLVQPEKKKLKANSVQAGKSPSAITNSAVQRVWSVEDELVLLHALSHHHNIYGKVPSSKEYDSFLTTIIGSLTFPATKKQLGNKIRTWKTNYNQRKKMGSKPKPLNPHEIEVFKICAKLFEDVSETKSVGGVAKANSSIYLREVISRQQLPTWLSTVEDVVQQLGESRARDLEAKAKQLSIDAIKLHAREEKFMADLFDVIADEMAGDG